MTSHIVINEITGQIITTTVPSSDKTLYVHDETLPVTEFNPVQIHLNRPATPAEIDAAAGTAKLRQQLQAANERAEKCKKAIYLAYHRLPARLSHDETTFTCITCGVSGNSATQNISDIEHRTGYYCRAIIEALDAIALCNKAAAKGEG